MVIGKSICKPILVRIFFFFFFVKSVNVSADISFIY